MNVSKFFAVLSENSKTVATFIVVLLAALAALFAFESCTATTRVLKTQDSTIHKEVEFDGGFDYSPTKVTIVESLTRTRQVTPITSFIWLFFMIPNFAKVDKRICAQNPDLLKALENEPDFMPYGVLFNSGVPNDIPTAAVYMSEVFDDPIHAREIYERSIKNLIAAQTGVDFEENKQTSNEDDAVPASDSDTE